MPDTLWSEIRNLKELARLETEVDVIRNALALYATALENQAEHGKLILREFNGEETEVDMVNRIKGTAL